MYNFVIAAVYLLEVSEIMSGTGRMNRTRCQLPWNGLSAHEDGNITESSATIISLTLNSDHHNLLLIGMVLGLNKILSYR